jgi:hypothetical protein
MINKDRAEYYIVLSGFNLNWKIAIQDEENDIVMRVEFFDGKTWVGEYNGKTIFRLDQSGEPNYHLHLSGEDEKIAFPEIKTREEKIEIAFHKLVECSLLGKINYGEIKLHLDDFDSHGYTKECVLEMKIENGVRQTGQQLGGVARIIKPI